MLVMQALGFAAVYRFRLLDLILKITTVNVSNISCVKFLCRSLKNYFYIDLISSPECL